jgi:hypothetical protein
MASFDVLTICAIQDSVVWLAKMIGMVRGPAV